MRTAINQLNQTEASLAPGISPTFLSPHAAAEYRPRLEHRPPVVRRLPSSLPPTTKVVKVKQTTQRKRKQSRYTDEILAQIPQWIDVGLTREQIASRIGTTLGSLQVTCSKKGISLWRKGRSRKQIEFAFENEQP
jgi:hypothetical protein